MGGALKVSLLAAMILLVSARASKYESLTEDLRYYVDKSLEKTRNDYSDHHVAYVSIKPAVTETTLNVNVHLKVSRCKKDPRNADKCVPQNNTLYLIDCLVCKTTENKELVDCGKWKEVKNNQREKRRKCKVSDKRLIGGNALFSRADDYQISCLGCM